MIVHGSSSSFILLIAAGIAQAQTFPLQLEYKATERIRSSAPIALDAELTWNGSGLLKGRLSISLSQSGKTISSVTSRPLVLTGGRNRVQIMLPDVEGRALSEVIELKTRFFPDEGPESIPLGDRSLLVSTEHKRIFRILYCNPFSVTLETDAPALLKSFSIQECWQPPGSTGLTPDTETRTTNQNSAPADQSRGKRIRLRNVSTTIRQSEPVNLSADPHWYCSFNIVVLTRSGFAQLRTPQLTALTQWVQAGGSLLVEPLGVLEERHTRFLNSLVHSPVQSTFSTDLNGTLKLPSDSAFRTLHAELGHVAILHQPLGKNQNYDSQVWKNLLAFLWKFRHEPLNFERRFNNNTGLLTANANGPGPGDLLFSPVQSGDSLLQQLVPEDIRTVPVSYIAVILVVYILAIGPGEYFLLGLINQRHLTWLTFPLLTAGFALFTVWLSNAYLSSASSRFH
ncbi:MAG: hypothetical protein VB858_07440, partial [Planctomycetaceae bacterium]